MSILDDVLGGMFDALKEITSRGADLCGAAFTQLFKGFSYEDHGPVAASRRNEQDAIDRHVPLCLIQFAQVPRPQGLIVERLEAKFGLSQDYRCEVWFYTDGQVPGDEGDPVTVPLNDVVSQPCVVTVHRFDTTRYIHAICTDLQVDPGHDVPNNRFSAIRRYKATLESPLAMDVWTNRSTAYAGDVDIQQYVVDQLLNDFPGTKGSVEWSVDCKLTRRPAPKRHWFRSASKREEFERRLGEYGIYYTFCHAKDNLALVLRDENPEPAGSPVPLAEAEKEEMPFGQVVSVVFDPRIKDTAGQGTHGSWGYMTSLRGQAGGSAENLPTSVMISVTPQGPLEGRYPAGAPTRAVCRNTPSDFGMTADTQQEVDWCAQLAYELRACRRQRFSCKVNSIKLAPGHIVKFDPEKSVLDCRDDPKVREQSYLVTEVRLSVTGPSAPRDSAEESPPGWDNRESGSAAAGPSSPGRGFSSELFCTMIPLDAPFRASWKPAEIPKPMPCFVYSPAVGPNGEPTPHYTDDGKLKCVLPCLGEDAGTSQPVTCFVDDTDASQFTCFPRHGRPQDKGQGTLALLIFTAPDRCYLGPAISSEQVEFPFRDQAGWVTGIKTAKHMIALDDRTEVATLDLGKMALLSTKDKLGITSKEIAIKAEKIILDADAIVFGSGGKGIQVKDGVVSIDSKGTASIQAENQVSVVGAQPNLVSPRWQQGGESTQLLTAGATTQKGKGAAPAGTSKAGTSNAGTSNAGTPSSSASSPASQARANGTSAASPADPTSASEGSPKQPDPSKLADAAKQATPAQGVQAGAAAAGATAEVKEDNVLDGALAWCKRQANELAPVLSVAGPLLSPFVPAAALLGACGGAIALASASQAPAGEAAAATGYTDAGGGPYDNYEVADASCALSDAACAQAGIDTAKQVATGEQTPQVAQAAQKAQEQLSEEQAATLANVDGNTALPAELRSGAQDLGEPQHEGWQA